MRVRFLTVLLAAAAVLPALSAVMALPAHADTPELPDRVAAGWRTDRVFVDERMRAAVPATELDRIRTAARTAGLPVYVALIPRTPAVQRADLPTLLQARIGEPGVYVVALVDGAYWSTTAQLYRPAGLRGRSLSSVRSDDKRRLDIVSDRPAPQVVRTIQQASTAYDGRALPPVPAADLEPGRERPERGLSVSDKKDRATAVGAGVGGLLAFVPMLVAALRYRPASKGSKGSKRSEADERPVEASRVRQLADSKIKQAEQALARLDRRRNKSSAQLDQRDDAYRRLDAAKTVRAEQPDDVLALAGAFVLARQADRVAAGAALQPPCFFDPTHAPGTLTVDWSDDVEVPACKSCATAVRRGRTPRGLRVQGKAGLLGRKPVPYWTLDPEDSPMVASGFGALSDDLPERIAARKDEVR
ncbi:hypothetical protein [Kribbella shirazensis]|uniref:TPM domain-containing protein n=1 Tax=Kribbella shirazensis TaxID=1105143 RepID=A0A7X6A034_9ACTN|nr:hypothetical protein [Kribbella shirazensis]NIK55759.1 hypothetical protein [Kribbella shirazensis]